MRHYELMCVFPGTLSEDEVPSRVQEVKKVLESSSATNLEIEDMGKSRLAYPMKHIRYGYFQIFRFESEPKDVNAVKEKIRLLNDVLRFMVHTYDPVMQVELQEKMKERRERKSEEKQDDDIEVEEKETVQETKKERPQKNDDMPEAKEKKEDTKKEGKRKTEEPKVNMDDIDEKLDEILDKTISDV